MKVDPVQQGTGKFLQVTAFFLRLADASQLHLAPAAGTGVHGRAQNEPGGESTAAAGPRNGHAPRFEGLAEHFEDVPLELRQFVQKEHPVVGQTDLPRTGIVAPAQKPRVRNGVVGRGEGPPGEDGRAGTQESQHAVDAAGFEGLLQRHGRQDPREPGGEHTFARTRRAAHEDIVAARRGDLQRPLGQLLALDFGEIRLGRLVLVQIVPELRPAREEFPLVHQIHRFAQRGEAENGKLAARGQGRFAGVAQRHRHGVDFSGTAQHIREGQRPLHGPERTVEGELPGKAEMAEPVAFHHARFSQQAESDGQIEGRSFLAQVRGRQIHHGHPGGQRVAGTQESRVDALPAFADRRVGQSHDGDHAFLEGGRASPAELHFHFHRERVYARDGGGKAFDRHVLRTPQLLRRKTPITSSRNPGP